LEESKDKIELKFLKLCRFFLLVFFSTKTWMWRISDCFATSSSKWSILNELLTLESEGEREGGAGGCSMCALAEWRAGGWENRTKGKCKLRRFVFLVRAAVAVASQKNLSLTPSLSPSLSPLNLIKKKLLKIVSSIFWKLSPGPSQIALTVYQAEKERGKSLLKKESLPQ
jgi:hypothetical protein